MSGMTRALTVVLLATAIVAAIVFNWSYIVTWVQSEQRSLQAYLARAIQSVRTGDQFAIATLVGACFMYGVLHAIGPGHGKLLIGSAAVASQRTAWRMATIGFFSSLMQAVSAVVLAYGGLGLVSATGSSVIGSANGLLAPLSFAAMAMVGIWIVARGIRLIAQPAEATTAHAATNHTNQQHHDTGHACDGGLHSERHHHSTHQHATHCPAGCKHMPTIDEAEKIESWQDLAALVVSIGIRPCSGALIVLIISWHLGLYAVGALGTLAMAVGTGLIVGLVAIFATTVRDSGFFRLGANGNAISLASFGRLQVLAGSLVVVVCLAFIASDMTSSAPTGIVR